MAGKKLRKGDKVEWETSQGTTSGKVEKKVTSETKIKGHKVKASKDNPEYVVTSDKTGAQAAHKPSALKKKKKKAREGRRRRRRLRAGGEHDRG